MPENPLPPGNATLNFRMPEGLIAVHCDIDDTYVDFFYS